MPYAITTRSRIKDRLQITSTGFDTLIDNLIVAVSARIERMCNRRFELSTYTRELYDGVDAYGTPRTTLILTNAPVTEIASVEYKSGSNSNPTWTAFTEDDYDIDMELGVLYFLLPVGRRNIRVSYTAGYNGFSVGSSGAWVFNAIPTGTVDGNNLTFTLPTESQAIIVYGDGLRISSNNYTFNVGEATFIFNAGQAPYSTISVDYLPAGGAETTDYTLPADLVEACEEIVVRLFKRRDSEGRSSETFNDSSITWTKNVMSDENIATIKNYRRASFV